MNLSNALIATDFSESAQWAVRRAASIARETGMRGTIAHVLPDTLPLDVHMQSSTRAQQALDLVTHDLENEGSTFAARLLSGVVHAELLRAAAQFDLTIAGARSEEILVDFKLGRTSAQLVSENSTPTLIVKQPVLEPYRRIVVAIDFSDSAHEVIDCAAQIAPHAHFELVHAVEVEYESMLHRGGAREDEIDRHRDIARAQAQRSMEAFRRGLLVDASRCTHTLNVGSPINVILEASKQRQAQLIVAGKHAYGMIEGMFVGSVALQVLTAAGCDVLVVPEDAA
jgi:nucleotide-binding universal stress UspA family protein